MRLPTRFCTLIATLLFCQVVSACPPREEILQHQKSLQVKKRWYSIGNPARGEPATVNSWPASGVFKPSRYCFVQQSDYNSLNTVLQAAIQKWSRVYEVSSLRIIPDLQFTPASLCSDPRVSKDAVRISRTNDVSSASLGYKDEGYCRRNGLEVNGRHWMKLFLQYTTDPANPHPKDVVDAMHELGHLAGLEHEHSRPDRDNFVTFFCEELADYEDARRYMMANPQLGITIDQAGEDRQKALSLDMPGGGFSASNYLPVSHADGYIGERAWSKRKYDYNSIMQYSSYQASSLHAEPGRGAGTPWPERSVLRDGRGGFEIFMDGNRDPALVRISDGDMTRIAQLYPSDNSAAAVANHIWFGTSMPIRMAKRTGTPVPWLE